MIGLTALELILKIVLTAMEGQPPAERAKMWAWFVHDVEQWRKLFKMDEVKP